MNPTKKQLKVSLSSKIADELRHDILLALLKEDDLLNEIELAEKYGVSRGPVRQAIAILANEGIVETLSNGRTKIIGFKTAEMQDYYSLRLYIESESIKKILLQPDDKNFQNLLIKLQKVVDISKSYQKHNLENELNEADIEFHLLIVEYANSQISKQVWKMLSNFNRSIMALKRLYLADQELKNLNSTINSHENIIESLSKRDLDATLKELTWHIENSIHIFKDILLNVNQNS